MRPVSFHCFVVIEIDILKCRAEYWSVSPEPVRLYTMQLGPFLKLVLHNCVAHISG